MRWSEIVGKPILETASSGATAAGAVATSVGAIGAGFDSNGHKGIYDAAEKKRKPHTKPTVLRR
jgi:hypothetical protein